MLCRTFCHLPGIGPAAERRLWDAGIDSWDAVEQGHPDLPSVRRERLTGQIAESRRQLSSRNAAHFAAGLPPAERWRLFPDFRDSVAYVDIETTGLGGPGDHITTIALYDGHRIRHYVHGRNLAAFAEDIRDCRLLVTFNGASFDLPMLRARFGIALDQAHIDLRHVLARLGFKGGLKACERRLGLDRGDLADVDGSFAVALWHEYRSRRDERALETLLAYNIRDVVNLEALLVTAYNLNATRTPFGPAVSLPLPTPPGEPFQAHAPTVQRLRERFAWRSW